MLSGAFPIIWFRYQSHLNFYHNWRCKVSTTGGKWELHPYTHAYTIHSFNLKKEGEKNKYIGMSFFYILRLYGIHLTFTISVINVPLKLEYGCSHGEHLCIGVIHWLVSDWIFDYVNHGWIKDIQTYHFWPTNLWQWAI